MVFLLPLFRQICYGGGLKAAFDKPFAGVGGKGKQAADAARAGVGEQVLEQQFAVAAVLRFGDTTRQASSPASLGSRLQRHAAVESGGRARVWKIRRCGFPDIRGCGAAARLRLRVRAVGW